MVCPTTSCIIKTYFGRYATSRDPFKDIISADKTLDQKLGKLCLERLNLILFFENDTLTEVPNSISRKASTAEIGTF